MMKMDVFGDVYMYMVYFGFFFDMFVFKDFLLVVYEDVECDSIYCNSVIYYVCVECNLY